MKNKTAHLINVSLAAFQERAASRLHKLAEKEEKEEAKEKKPSVKSLLAHMRG